MQLFLILYTPKQIYALQEKKFQKKKFPTYPIFLSCNRKHIHLNLFITRFVITRFWI